MHVCVSAHVDASKRMSVYWGTAGRTGLKWKCGHCRFPSLPDQIYSQYRLPVSLLLYSTDEPGRSQTDAPGDWSVTGNGGREQREGREKDRERCEE